MKHVDDTYKELCELILSTGEYREDRTGVGTKSIFGHQMRFDLSQGFPLITTKKIFFNGVLDELFWFIQGGKVCEQTFVNRMNLNDLPTRSHNMWKWWAKDSGDLGRIYGAQWRDWKHTDQLGSVVRSIIDNPYSRRHIVSSWNVAELDDMTLPPCHVLFQFYVSTSGKLSCHLYQRSADVFLGLPFNIASYALLTHIVARATGLVPGELVHSLGDAHIYLNHEGPLRSQLLQNSYPMPTVEVADRGSNIDSYTSTDIVLKDYKCHPPIKANVAI
jgi:thymidylate synthase